MRMWDCQGCSIIHSPLRFIRSATSFSLSSPLQRHTDYALSLYPQWRSRNHTLSFEHERQSRKNNKDNRSLHVSKCACVFGCACRLFTHFSLSLTWACMHIKDVIWICLSDFAGVSALMLCFCIYLCVSARLCHVMWYRGFHVYIQNIFCVRRQPVANKSAVLCSSQVIKTLGLNHNKNFLEHARVVSLKTSYPQVQSKSKEF